MHIIDLEISKVSQYYYKIRSKNSKYSKSLVYMQIFR